MRHTEPESILNKRTELVSKCRHGNCKKRNHKSNYNPAQIFPHYMQVRTCTQASNKQTRDVMPLFSNPSFT